MGYEQAWSITNGIGKHDITRIFMFEHVFFIALIGGWLEMKGFMATFLGFPLRDDVLTMTHVTWFG